VVWLLVLAALATVLIVFLVLRSDDGTISSGGIDVPAEPAAAQVRVEELQEQFMALQQAEQESGALIQEVSAIAEAHPQLYDAQRLLGQLHLQRRDWAAAYGPLAAAAAMRPTDAPMQSLVGSVAMRLSDHEAAIEHYAAAVEHEAGSARHHVRLANAYLANAQPEQARPQLEAALRINAASPEAHGMMAMLLDGEAELEDAVRHATAALRFTPYEQADRRVELARRLMALHLRRDRPGDAYHTMMGLGPPMQFDPRLGPAAESAFAELVPRHGHDHVAPLALAYYHARLVIDPEDADARAGVAAWSQAGSD
jgi:tetratricopeptide (TPR) repeat protein